MDNDREVTEYFSQLYEQVPQSVALPLKYFSFINNYVKIYSSKHNELENRLEKIKVFLSFDGGEICKYECLLWHFINR